MAKPGLLLVNLGTPDSTDVEDVRQFLREFLSDPLVLGGFTPVRKALVEFVICPVRGPKSAEAYKKVWTEQGSPIAVYGRALAEKVAAQMPEVVVELAMRYRVPSIAEALERLRTKGVDRLVVLPLFPQFSSSTTESVIREFNLQHKKLGSPFEVTMIRDFYEHASFIDAAAAIARPSLEAFSPDLVLMSYHGVPEDYLRKDDPSGSRCLWSPTCCDVIDDVNRYCYRAQCMATSRALARVLALEDGRWRSTFQSRFGPKIWTGPYTDKVVEELPADGVKRLAVMCPAFTADCLETIEEIGMELRHTFLEAGGEAFEVIPCVNDDARWVEGVAAMTREALAEA